MNARSSDLGAMDSTERKRLGKKIKNRRITPDELWEYDDRIRLLENALDRWYLYKDDNCLIKNRSNKWVDLGYVTKDGAWRVDLPRIRFKPYWFQFRKSCAF